MDPLLIVLIVVVALVRRYGGGTSLYATAAILGVTDADALTVSLSRPEAAIGASMAARAIVIGVIASTLLKLSIAAAIGHASFRRRAVAGLGVLALGGVVGVLLA